MRRMTNEEWSELITASTVLIFLNVYTFFIRYSLTDNFSYVELFMLTPAIVLSVYVSYKLEIMDSSNEILRYWTKIAEKVYKNYGPRAPDPDLFGFILSVIFVYTSINIVTYFLTRVYDMAIGKIAVLDIFITILVMLTFPFSLTLIAFVAALILIAYGTITGRIK